MVRALGVLILLAGLAMLGYFCQEFDISVRNRVQPPDFNPYYYAPGRSVNEGLMNDRIIGTLVSSAAALAGIVICVLAKPRQRIRFEKVPAPLPPIGFSHDLSFAVYYKPRPTEKPAMVRTEWDREVSRVANLRAYLPEQIEWAFGAGVDPKDFARFIAFIAEYRTWQFAGGRARVE